MHNLLHEDGRGAGWQAERSGGRLKARGRERSTQMARRHWSRKQCRCEREQDQEAGSQHVGAWSIVLFQGLFRG